MLRLILDVGAESSFQPLVGASWKAGGATIKSTIESNPCPEVDIARCTGCGRCVAACAERLLSLEVSGYRKHAVLKAPQRCTRCLDCLVACPVGALKR